MTRPESTLFWHDYETTGVDPRRDRPLQFAGRRTTLDLEPIGDPLVLWCRPARDTLPHPEALLLTGITPQEAEARGLRECEFADRIEEELASPGTCGVGYNSIRFDDEVTRHLLWRNLHDPYGREWRHGNARWDLIDLARLACALRPDGIEWPERAPGVPSFRLEDLARANGLAHDHAHDALSDVDATIALARRLKSAQPRLFDFHFALRQRTRVEALLDWIRVEPVLHASSRYPAERHRGLALVAPLMQVPGRRSEIVVLDLDEDPDPLITLDADDIADRLFTPRADLPEDVARMPLKTVHTNRSPALAPLSVLRPEDARRLALDVESGLAKLATLRAAIEPIREKLARVYNRPPRDGDDPDVALYAGFIPDPDLRLLPEARSVLRDREPSAFDLARFADPRLREIAWRYAARNAPHQLADRDADRWRRLVRSRLLGADEATTIKRDELVARTHALRETLPAGDRGHAVLDALLAWAAELTADLECSNDE
jgi:exodeoxyribonuclease-1